MKLLECACCGQACKGKQWFNQDRGYGLCPDCYRWLLEDRKMDPEELRRAYGVWGVNITDWRMKR